MRNMKQRACGRRIYTFLVTCLVAVMNLQGYASVKVHVQYLTTADGLSNNSVRYIHQDSKGFIWMSSLNIHLCRPFQLLRLEERLFRGLHQMWGT